MANSIKIFENEEFGQVRTLVINDEPWFVGKDVCVTFGDKNHNRSLGRIDDTDKKVMDVTDSMGRIQRVTFINESGLYSLLFAMQPQKANNGGVQDAYPIETQERIEKLHRFKRWVTTEVLPSIRKHGAYMTPETIESVLFNPDTIIKLATSLKEERERRQTLELENAEMKPKAEYADAVQGTVNSINIGNLAKLLCNKHNVKIGRNKLFEWLTLHGIIKKVGKQYEPYQKYMDMGLFIVKQSVIQLKDGKTITTQTVQVTGKGQVYLANKIAQDFRNNKKETKE